VLGVDIGGVLIDRAGDESDTSFFGSDYLCTPMVAGARPAVGRLVEIFAGEVHVISKAGVKIAARSRAWLEKHAFFDDGFLDEDRLHFVRRREDKRVICERFGVTHFVDDRMDVLCYLAAVPHRYLFIGGLGPQRPPSSVPPGISVVTTWSETVAAICADLARRH
jgi:hypothetical protein